MTRKRPSEREAKALRVACRECQRDAGWWCVTVWTRRPGALATNLHNVRHDDARASDVLPIELPGGTRP